MSFQKSTPFCFRTTCFCVGDNQHIGLREGLRKLPIDGDIPSYHSNIVELATPPHVLTLEQSFPVVDEADEKTEHPSVVSFDSSKHM